MCPPFVHKHTHVSQPSSWPRCITFSASPRPYITRFSRDLPVPPGFRDPAHSQWLDQHFQFPENHNLSLPHHNLSTAARSMWRTRGLLCTAGGRKQDPALQTKVWVHTRSPACLGAVCSLLFGTFKHSQDLEATQVSTDHGWIKMLRFTYTTVFLGYKKE